MGEIREKWKENGNNWGKMWRKRGEMGGKQGEKKEKV